MRITDPRLYLRALGIDNSAMCQCSMPGCTKVFRAEEGVAFPGKGRNTEQVSMFLFCSFECYLGKMPENLMPRG